MAIHSDVCPKCGAAVPAGASEGLCTRCLLEAVTHPTDGGGGSGVGPRRRAEPVPLARVAAAFPHLEVVELIGAGGMGAVYKARQPKLDRWVALKLLPQDLGREPAFAERFLREARMLARLSHPNVVAVYDFGQVDGLFYLLMEYVDGVNLRQAMRAGGFAPAQALALVPQICAALQFAHDQGVMHRDVKPENILLDARGRVKLADFGIAKLLGQEGSEPGLTVTGAAVGTPQYMAPEQIERPGDVDHRADIYSLGVVFYELLTGELPLGRFAPPSSKTPVDPRVDAIVFRALAKERELRQQSANEVRTAVEGVGSAGHPAPAAASSSLSSCASGGDRTPAPWWEASPRYRLGMLGVLASYALATVLEQRTRGGALVEMVVESLRGFGLPALAVLVGVAGCLWAVAVLLRREAVWLHPLGLPPGDGRAEGGLAMADRGIRYSFLVLLACLALSVVSTLIPSLVELAYASRGTGSFGATLWMLSAPAVLLWAWARGWRDAQRDGAPGAEPMPAWAMSMALGLAVFGLLATVAVLGRREDAGLVVYGNGEFVLPACLALWTRSRFWRGMGLVLSGYAALVSAFGVAAIASLSGQDPASLTARGMSGDLVHHPVRAAVTILPSVVLFGLAWWTLRAPEVRRAFGLGSGAAGSGSPVGAAVGVPHGL